MTDGDAGGGTGRASGPWPGLAGLDLSGQKVRFQSLFFVQFVAFSGIAVFRNVYFDEMGLSGTAMGQIGFVLLATGVVAQPAWGALTDYLRAERPVLVAGSVLSALALLSYPYAEGLAEPFLVVAVGTALFSAFRGPIIPIATGMILERGYDYGGVRAFGSLAFAVGSLGFGFVVAWLGSVSIVYAYIAGMALLVVIVISLSGSSDGDEADDSGGGADQTNEDDAEGADDTDNLSIPAALRALVSTPSFVVVVLSMFLLRLSLMGGEAFFSVYMRELSVQLAVGPWTLSPDGMTGVGWAINSGIEALAFVYAVRLRRSYKWLLVVGGVVGVTPNLVYGLTTHPVALLAVQSMGGVGFALLTVAAVNLVHAVASDRVNATAQSLLSALGLGLGGALGQIVAGSLFDAVGLQQMYVVIAVIGFAGAAFGLFVTHEGRLDGDATPG